MDPENVFIYHPPKGDQQIRYEKIRNQAKQFSYLLKLKCPDSEERDIAIRKLRECVMWANASIAINEV